MALQEPPEEGEWFPEEGGSRVVPIPGAFKLTDLGNAERLVTQWKEKIRFCPQRGKWLLWDKTRWRWDETFAIDRLAMRTVRAIYREASQTDDKDERRRIFEWAHKSEQARSLSAMVQLAGKLDGVPVEMRELDADPWLLNAKNGTVDLRTGELRGHNRADLITRTTGIDFNPARRSALWDKILAHSSGDDPELAQYLQVMCGYTLIGTPIEKAFFFLFGPRDTAKSTFIDAMHAAMGTYAISADFDTWLVQTNTGGNRGDIVRLAGARLVTSVEVKHGAKWDEALLKRVTGGDVVVAQAKFESQIEFVPAFTLVLAANDAPTAREDDDGLWLRLRRIPLLKKLAEEEKDKTIKTRIHEPEHAEAILAWMVQGCLDYLRMGKLGDSYAVQKSTNEYRADLDHFSEFLSDRYVLTKDEGDSVLRSNMRDSYESWGKEVGRKHLLDSKKMAAKLRSAGCSERGTGYMRAWVGLKAVSQNGQ